MKAYEKQLKQRIFFLLGVFAVLTAMLMAKVFQHQVLLRDKYMKWAKDQEIRPVSLAPLRGKILDRRGSPMAVSVRAGSVFAHPRQVSAPREAANRLAPLLEMDPEEIYRRLSKDRSFVWLAHQIPLEQARAIPTLNQDGKLNGIGVGEEGKRYYPNLHLAAHLIGFVGHYSKGWGGLEYYYEQVEKRLPGENRELLLQRDAKGKLFWQPVVQRPGQESGCSLELTVDLRIQSAAEEALARAVHGTEAESGSAVVLDPGTGEILAMASMPTFDPNRYQDFPNSHRRIQAIWFQFEPGSTVKALLLAAALEEKAVNENTLFRCGNGRMAYGKQWIHDTTPHAELTVREILVHSSNIGAALIAHTLGKESLWRYYRSFGFGGKTGVDLPGEREGRIRNPKTWAPIETATHAFGQGFSVTALQLATAFGALANGGFLVEPYIARRIVDGAGQVVKAPGPRVVRRVISKETSARVLDVLTDVVARGTGRHAQIEGFRVAGKTGTAQKYDNVLKEYSSERYVVSFVGIVPADRPEFVIVVVLNEPKGKVSGGATAAPVFREIAALSLYYRHVPTEEDLRFAQRCREHRHTALGTTRELAGITPYAASQQRVRSGG